MYEELNELLSQLKRMIRHETPTTFEAVGVQAALMDASDSDFPQDIKQECDRLLKYISGGQTDKAVGPYIVSHYIDMIKQLGELLHKILLEDEWSRQHIISFPKKHCFQYIQFLIRGNNVHVLANMRSCDFEKNFVHDLYLSYYCGKVIAELLGLLVKKRYTVNVLMTIGSLHIYKKGV